MVTRDLGPTRTRSACSAPERRVQADTACSRLHRHSSVFSALCGSAEGNSQHGGMAPAAAPRR